MQKIRLALALVFLGFGCLVNASFAAPQDAPAAPPESQPATSQPTEQDGPGAAGQEGGRGRRGAGQGGGQDGQRPAGDMPARKPRLGIPVTEPLVVSHCAICHKVDENGYMGRVSYMRKSPEGWEISLKRMIRLNQLPITPEDAKSIVRYLANDHGLTRDEAKRGLYESERRIHWSDAKDDEDLKKTCAACHTLGRVHSEQRDAEEWKLLKATHLAYFPLANFQAFQAGGRGGEGGPPIDFQNMSEGEIEDAMERRREAERAKGDRADRVLEQLAKDQPLFTPDWNSWKVNRREVPLAGTWLLSGHEIGRGNVAGTVLVKRVGDDEYTTEWTVRFGDGQVVKRQGKGILYGGYSWRGRSELTAVPEGQDKKELKEVLLLSGDWDRFEGRVFGGAYGEVGLDVVLDRQTGQTRVTAIQNGAMMIPSTGNVVDVFGDGFTEGLAPGDFSLGRGCTITAIERDTADHVRLVVDVDRKAERGFRQISYKSRLGPSTVVLYDTIDYIRVLPERGLARIGGARHPKQFERFECVAMNRGPDDELRTADDYQVKIVPVTWSIEEFPVREDDDDVRYVGVINPTTGFFEPGADGPNPARQNQTNNIGDVYVVASCTLTVQKIPPKPKPKPASRPTSGPTTQPDSQPTTRPEPPAPESAPTTRPEEPKPIVMETKTFRARGRLIVTVPLYARWDALEWEDE